MRVSSQGDVSCDRVLTRTLVFPVQRCQSRPGYGQLSPAAITACPYRRRYGRSRSSAVVARLGSVSKPRRYVSLTCVLLSSPALPCAVYVGINGLTAWFGIFPGPSQAGSMEISCEDGHSTPCNDGDILLSVNGTSANAETAATLLHTAGNYPHTTCWFLVVAVRAVPAKGVGTCACNSQLPCTHRALVRKWFMLMFPCASLFFFPTGDQFSIDIVRYYS